MYKGTASSASISGLSEGTYRVTVIDYNGTPGNERYLVTGTAPANVTIGTLAPTLSAYGLAFSNTTATGTTLSWAHNGNGSARAVFIARVSGGAAIPVNATTYTANATFAAGTQIGATGWYCVYKGTGSSVNISGLSANTGYRVTVIEYNGTSGSEKYLVTGTSPANFTTGAAGFGNRGGNDVLFTENGSAVKPVEAANILTPNNDGSNDTWIVKYIGQYPGNIVTIFDAAGKIVFTKKDYANDWTGYSNGVELNTGTYYYFIDLGNGAKVKGFVTLVR